MLSDFYTDCRSAKLPGLKDRTLMCNDLVFYCLIIIFIFRTENEHQTLHQHIPVTIEGLVANTAQSTFLSTETNYWTLKRILKATDKNLSRNQELDQLQYE